MISTACVSGTEFTEFVAGWLFGLAVFLVGVWLSERRRTRGP